jgi:hypothetical protein
MGLRLNERKPTILWPWRQREERSSYLDNTNNKYKSIHVFNSILAQYLYGMYTSMTAILKCNRAFMGMNRPFLRYRGLLEFYCFRTSVWGAQEANSRKNCRLWSSLAILKFWLISDYSLCCIALTEYVLFILWIAHDFIALKMTFL